MNVEGMSLAGGKADAPSIGSAAIVLEVLRNRARVEEGEKGYGGRNV